MSKNSRFSGNEKKLLQKLRYKAYLKQNKQCYWCNKPMVLYASWTNDPYACTAEHVIPLNMGGVTDKDNIVAAHAVCNLHRTGQKRNID